MHYSRRPLSTNMSGEVRLTLRLPRIATAQLKCGCPVEVPLLAIPFERPLQGTVDGHRAFVAHRCVSVIAISMVSPHYFLLLATTRSVTDYLSSGTTTAPAGQSRLCSFNCLTFPDWTTTTTTATTRRALSNQQISVTNLRGMLDGIL